jgi:NADH-quinone oxidoreductase subunit J
MNLLWISDLMFYMFGLVVLTSAMMVICMRNPVHAVLSLILTFLGAFGLCILLGAEFVAYSLVIVYVGAVAVLFLFVVMMLNIQQTSLKKGVVRYTPIATIIGGVLLIDLLLVIKHSSPLGIAASAIGREAIITDSALNNTMMIGTVLYTDYFFPFQMAGLVLLVAMIGCILLTLRDRKGTKRQNASAQLARTREQSVALVHVKSGEGIDSDILK